MQPHAGYAGEDNLTCIREGFSTVVSEFPAMGEELQRACGMQLNSGLPYRDQRVWCDSAG
jgi:hypothetical protein